MTAGGHDGRQCECGYDHTHGGDELSADHVLLASIGNSRIAVATWADDCREAAKYFALDKLNEAVGVMQQMWDSFPPGSKRVVLVASVNPPRFDEIRKACVQRHIGPLLVIGEDIAPPIAADVHEPEKVGTDRLCAAAAAFVKMKGACAVADFGTAVTIDLVADDGVFLGGTILPGMSLCARALHEHTALLPLVELGRPTETLGKDATALGKDTTSAIRNGIFAMMAGALREITERYATDIGKWPPLVVTGGDAEVVAQACDFIDRIAPDLALDGMVIAWQNACEPQETE